MNVHVRLPAPTPGTTLAAEGLPRRAFTVDDVEHMVRTGILSDQERFELIGGEIVPMTAKGIWHENVKVALQEHWFAHRPQGTRLITESTLRAGDQDFREPDFLFWKSDVRLDQVTPTDVHLIVEIADSSLGDDLGPKAVFHASIGIADYWVVDARRLVTHIHRAPEADSYRAVTQHAAADLLVPLLLPSIALRLADLPIEAATG